MTVAILVLIPLPPATQEKLRNSYTLHYFPKGIPADALDADAANQISAVATNGTMGISVPLMNSLPNLKLVCFYGVGFEGIDIEYARSRGIAVANAPDTNGETVADHAVGMMLALARGYGDLTNALKRGQWDDIRAARPTLNGANVGIIGMGGVGRAIAKRVEAFGASISYAARSAKADVRGKFVPEVVDLAEGCDFLVAACPGGAETRHLVNSAVLDKLGKNGFVINVARGSVVDTSALIKALQDKSIAGAGLDVFEGEPSLPADLLALENVVMTPHMAGRSPAAQVAQREALLSNLSNFFAKRPLVSTIVAAPN